MTFKKISHDDAMRMYEEQEDSLYFKDKDGNYIAVGHLESFKVPNLDRYAYLIQYFEYSYYDYTPMDLWTIAFDLYEEEKLKYDNSALG